MNELYTRLLTAVRAKDVELSEDLARRLGNFSSVAELNNFFHGIIAQYTTNTIDLRGSLLVTESFDEWLNHFVNKILPYMSKKRLPPCTNPTVENAYQLKPS